MQAARWRCKLFASECLSRVAVRNCLVVGWCCFGSPTDMPRHYNRQTTALKYHNSTKRRRERHEALRWNDSLEFVQWPSVEADVPEVERFQDYVAETCHPHLFFCLCGYWIGTIGGPSTTRKGLVACITFHTSLGIASVALARCY
ncbi:hypothetical protein, unlikely [Trypanosoma congolense IL3000]|uniref:Uncharacterized protein n=1 Tax=Trypanosoma congolense (strain IL3000) TaxID=1068625 RepID=F9W3R1_TRYCI|nr:hypothetical protein, unlikely [Trypanosoma congolense IL3000]